MPILTLLGLIWCIRWAWRSYPKWSAPNFKLPAIESAKFDRWLIRGALIAIIIYVLSQL